MKMSLMRHHGLLALILSAALLAGCAGNSAQSPSATHSPASNPDTVTLSLLAAASLTESFQELADDFEASHPGTTVSLDFAGSQTLVDQLDNGAPADLLATADETSMKRAEDASLVEKPQVFTSNLLTLITSKGNPAHVTGLDSSLNEARLVVCAQEVPCGRATAKLTSALGITLNPVSEEDRVTEVRARVESGEADAGIVYRTDAKASGNKVDTVEIPGAESVINRYPIAVVKDAAHKDAAQEFMDLVLSEKGQKVLDHYGFTRP